jgi:hypothetical protein
MPSSHRTETEVYRDPSKARNPFRDRVRARDGPPGEPNLCPKLPKARRRAKNAPQHVLPCPPLIVASQLRSAIDLAVIAFRRALESLAFERSPALERGKSIRYPSECATLIKPPHQRSPVVALLDRVASFQRIVWAKLDWS